MPTILRNRFEPLWNGYPPHMSAEDYEIWKRWRAEAIKDAIALYFDVGLGGQTEVPPDTTPEMALMWLHNTQKRIDVLIETQKSWKIVELRHNATASALGRLIMYRNLWKSDPPDDRPVELMLVTDKYDPDVEAAAKELGIEYIKA